MEDVKLGEQASELRDGMRIEWDVPISMDDDLVLRADIYRPVENGRYPVIMSYGPYGKGLLFEDLYADQWRRMVEAHPDVTSGSTNKYQNWEVVDPEKWVPDGYAVIRVDSRGAARSPGLLDIWSAREAKDFYDCIEWAAEQPWSNGKIGLNGISYYAMNQWQVAALQPPHLTAMCIWEGAADFYRDLSHHGGILCTFGRTWFPSQVITVQHGQGTRGLRSAMNGDWISGPATLSEEELGANRREFYDDCYNNPLDAADYWQSRMPDWSKITVPLFSAGNWADRGSTRVATSRASFARRLSTSGSRSTASNTGLSSTPTTASICKRSFLVTFSSVRTPAGWTSRKCNFRYAIPENGLSNATKTRGRCRAPNGPSSICTPPTLAFQANHRPRRARSPMAA